MIIELTTIKDDWCIKVMIIRLWKLKAFKKSIGENKIDATVKQNFCPKLKRRWKKRNASIFILLELGTRKELPVSLTTKIKLTLISLPMSLHVTLIVDQFMGLGDLISCGNIDHAMVEGNKRPFIRLELDYLTNITLWSDYAHQLNNALGDHQNLGHVVIILQHIYFFHKRAILAPTHEVVKVIDHLLSQILGEEIVYYSSDTICESESLDNTYTESLYSPEVLNSLNLSDIPNRNLALVGTNVGHTTIILRLKLSPSGKRLPLKINRRQFSLDIYFAMTINKSQGKSLSKVGIFLPKPVYTLGQLYVVRSRVKSQKALKVLIYDKDPRFSRVKTCD
nr:ATP-dependent DNA helicase PIF1-like [Tanacetum cinerariifolium]